MFFYFLCVCFAYMYICIQHSGSTHREQKWALDPPKLGHSQLLCGCWELNMDPLQEQSMLLTTERFLQPCIKLLNFDVCRMDTGRGDLTGGVTQNYKPNSFHPETRVFPSGFRNCMGGLLTLRRVSSFAQSLLIETWLTNKMRTHS